MSGLISQSQLLGNALRFAEQNHQVISQNLANLNTPGYQAKELEFKQLYDAIEDSPNSAVDGFEVTAIEGLSVRADGNNVDLDREIASLKKGSMVYQTLIQVMSSKMGIMNRAING